MTCLSSFQVWVSKRIELLLSLLVLWRICPSFLLLPLALTLPPLVCVSLTCYEWIQECIRWGCAFMCFCNKMCSFSFRAILEPLSSLSPPAHSVFIVVDSLDSGCCGGDGVGQGWISGSAATPSSSIAELLFRHVQLLPPWILLVGSVRRQNKAICKMFSGIAPYAKHSY